MENYEFAAAFDYTDEDDPNNNCVTVDTNGLDIIYAVMYRASRGDGDNSGHEDLRDSTHAVAQVIAEEYIFDNYLTTNTATHTTANMKFAKGAIREDHGVPQIVKDYFLPNVTDSQMRDIVGGVGMN